MLEGAHRLPATRRSHPRRRHHHPWRRLTFANRYGTSAVIATYDEQGLVVKGKPVEEPPTCGYHVLASPNVVVQPGGDLAAVASFGNVGCGVDSNDQPTVFAAYDTDAGVQLLVMGDLHSGPAAAFMSLATVAVEGPDAAFADPATKKYPFSKVAREGDVVTFSVDTPTGSALVSATCTGPTFAVPEFNKLVKA